MRNLNSFVRHGLAPLSAALLCAGFLMAGTALSAQTAPSTAPPSDSTSQTATQTSVGNSAPITVQETLSSLKYNNRWEAYVGIGYERFKAGPNFLENSALGGFDARGTRWFTSRLGATANVRGYYGTSPATPNTFGIRGPFVSNHFFMAGPEFLGPHNIHAAVTLHALAGGSYGSFSSDLGPYTPAQVGLFNNQLNFAGDAGAAIDLNRSSKIALRIAPDMLVTHYGGNFAPDFSIAVGILYRFDAKR